MYPFNMDFKKPWAGLPVYDEIKQLYRGVGLYYPEAMYQEMRRPEAFILEDSTFINSHKINDCYRLTATNMLKYGERDDLINYIDLVGRKPNFNSVVDELDRPPDNPISSTDKDITYFYSPRLPAGKYGPVSFE